MKLVITEAGFKGYTGQMGVVNFVDGVSTSDVSPHDAIRMSAVMGFAWEDGTSPSVSQALIDKANDAPPVFDADAADYPPAAVAAAQEKARELKESFTEDQLAEIADKQGIAGLRSIAEPLGIKGNSIRGLMDAILKAAPAPAAE